MEVVEEFRGLIAEFKDSIKDLKNVVNDLKDLSCCKVNADNIETKEESKKESSLINLDKVMDVSNHLERLTENLGNSGSAEKQNEHKEEEVTVALKVFKNILIIEKIIGYMTVKELGVCRLVEKSVWFPIATKYLKRRGLINLNGPYDEKGKEQPPNRVYRDLHQYCQELPNFQTENLALGRGFVVTQDRSAWKSFLQKFGTGIKYLRMDYPYNVKTLQNILSSKYLTNLETFDLRVLPDLLTLRKASRLFPDGFQVPILPRLKRIEFWNHGACPRSVGKEFVDDLFSMGPNITSVKIVDRYGVGVDEYVLAALESRPKLIANINQLELDCVDGPTTEDLKVIEKMKLKLLYLGVIYKMKSPEPLQSLLDSQCKTLEDLQLGNIFVCEPMQIKLPRFEVLSRLELTTDIPNGNIFAFSFGSLSYDETFPRLKHLSNCRSKTFYPRDMEATDNYSRTYSRMSPRDGKKFFTGMSGLWKELFPQNGNPVQTVTTLDIPYPKTMTESTNNKFFYQLCEMFPNVNNEFFQGLRNGTIKIEPSETKKNKKPKKITQKASWTVYHLLESVKMGTLPSQMSVLVDYGFINCKNGDETSILFSIYTAIIKLFECDLEELHQASLQGKLAEFIVKQYKSRGVATPDNYCYAWFLKNKHIVKNPYPI